MRINEDKHLASKMLKVELAVKMDMEAHVPDMMTLVRVLPSVAVVGQTDRVERSTAEGTTADIYVKFLPVPGSVYFNLVRLCKSIKALKGVKIVKVEKLGGRNVVFKGAPIVI
jgi:hypothetical protein